MSILQNLTEGLVDRDLRREGQAIMNKWEATGLLEGLAGARSKENMSLLLENQAKELLREASSMAAGDVEGFASVAFPIVRRVFGNLFANDLVSVQPMSLPAGLVFFLDFTFEGSRAGYLAGDSVYGQNVVGKGLVDGVDLVTNGGGGMYNLNTGYSSPTGSATCAAGEVTAAAVLDGGADSALNFDPDLVGDVVIKIAGAAATGASNGWNNSDGASTLAQMNATMTTAVTTTALSLINHSNFDENAVVVGEKGDLYIVATDDGSASAIAGVTIAANHKAIVHLKPIRRHTKATFSNAGSEGLSVVTALPQLAYELVTVVDANALATSTEAEIKTAISTAAGAEIATLNQTNIDDVATGLAAGAVSVTIPLVDNFNAGGSLGTVVGADTWGLEEPKDGTGNAGSSDTNKNEISEIDIKVDSVAVTAVTKKLKAKWSQELGQDLQAYQNLDAEVELTGILSEQIALEIDREIINDLIQGATAGKFYWSRRPGKFVNRTTGADLTNGGQQGPDFTGNVSEWYETLVETINDLSAQIHRKVLRGGANFVVTSPEIANLLEFTSGFRASVTHSDEKGTIGGIKAGSISKKFDVFVDPYFPRNLLLVGRNGSSFLESGYVYAPYVPLQVTPTIFGTEDFVPRKGVLTRYAKKMVRPDMYGLVVVTDLLG